MKKTLSTTEISWHGLHFLDQNVKAFHYKNEQYKAIRPTASPLFFNTSFDIFLKTLSDEGFIPTTTISDIHVENFVKVYHQHSEYFKIHLWHSCPLTIKDAALLFIRFNRWLYKRDLVLTDGHAYNIVIHKFDAPFWCDIGSIAPLTKTNQLVAIDEFIRFLVYPLLLRKKHYSLGKMMRFSLREGINHPMAQGLQLLDTSLTIPTNRLDALQILEDFVSSIEFPWETSLWSDYAKDLPCDTDNPTITQGAHNRTSMIMRFVKIFAPKTVVDLGANAGVFSRLITNYGAQVLAIEPDESAVSRGHMHLQEHGAKSAKAPIKFSVGDVTAEHEQGDLALALALTHHLFLTNHYPWQSIAKLLANHTNKNLITEFMPYGLHTKSVQPHLPAHYTIEHFVKELYVYFTNVEIVEYPYPDNISPRILLICSGKKHVA